MRLLLAALLVGGCTKLVEDDRCGPLDPPYKSVVVIDAAPEADVGPCEPFCVTTGRSSCRFTTAVDDAGHSLRAAECTQTVVCE